MVELRARLEKIIKPEHDSLRYYHLGNNWERRVDHVGAKPTYNVEGPLIV
jgi:CRISPR-associated protein Cas2